MMRSKEPITKCMKHKYKGLKENPVILIEKKIYEHQKTKKIKKILQNALLFRGHLFVLHEAWFATETFERKLNTVYIFLCFCIKMQKTIHFQNYLSCGSYYRNQKNFNAVLVPVTPHKVHIAESIFPLTLGKCSVNKSILPLRLLQGKPDLQN